MFNAAVFTMLYHFCHCSWLEKKDFCAASASSDLQHLEG